jgi:hypothetical protein
MKKTAATHGKSNGAGAVNFAPNNWHLPDLLSFREKASPATLASASGAEGSMLLGRIEAGQAISADGKQLMMHVIGCIDYAFSTDQTIHHQTGFILQLSKNRPPLLISPDEGTIPVEHLMLIESGIGVGRYAD